MRRPTFRYFFTAAAHEFTNPRMAKIVRREPAGRSIHLGMDFETARSPLEQVPGMAFAPAAAEQAVVARRQSRHRAIASRAREQDSFRPVGILHFRIVVAQECELLAVAG